MLLLELQLLLVGQILPLASAADAEVLAEGRCAYITIINESYHLALSERVLLATYLHVNDVARYTERHENNEFVPVKQALAFGGYGLNRDILYHR